MLNTIRYGLTGNYKAVPAWPQRPAPAVSFIAAIAADSSAITLSTLLVVGVSGLYKFLVVGE